MGQVIQEVKEGKNYSVAQVGKLEELDRYETRSKGKLFLKDALKLTGMEVSLNKLAPGEAVPFSHQHKNNEELYIFIKGTGQFQIDGEIIEVREGTVIRVAPEGVRAWRNHSTEDLYYIVIQAAAGSLQTWTGSDGIIVEKEVSWPQA
ncbi:MAG: cupin domain-containing protein [Alicyclobacillaceae bacterium]|nr:cupin domain-containing protein [Alicyclobacillaceae bacterium]